MWLLFSILLIIDSNSYASKQNLAHITCKNAIKSIPNNSILKESKELLQENQKIPTTEAFRACLSEYIQINTINPPGNEERAIAFFQPIFQELKIPTKIISATNKRKSLIATLAGKKSDAIALYNHTDTVPVFPDQWENSALPLSGELRRDPNDSQEYIWGRGALDMKSTAIFQLLTVALYQKNNIQPEHTLLFLASADEEVGSSGALSLLPHLAKVKVLFNEGGYGIQRKEKKIFLLGTEEKGGAWLKIQHTAIPDLLTQLHKTFFLLDFAQSAGKQKSSLWKACSLENFETKQAQVNVIPSAINFTLLCSHLNSNISTPTIQQELEKTFTAKELPTAKVSIQPTSPNNKTDIANSFSISIKLENAGHGSLGALSALDLATKGFQSLGIIELGPTHIPPYFRYFSTTAVKDFITTLLSFEGVPFADHIARIGIDLFEQPFLKKIASLAYSERLFRTSCTFTALQLSQSFPPEALVDCRLLHTGFAKKTTLNHADTFNHADAFIDELENYANDNKLKITKIKGWNFTRSFLPQKYRDFFINEIHNEYPNAYVTSYLTPTSSDSTWFRPNILSYGFFPVVLRENLTATVHGSNERFPLSQALSGLKIYSQVIWKIDSIDMKALEQGN